MSKYDYAIIKNGLFNNIVGKVISIEITDNETLVFLDINSHNICVSADDVIFYSETEIKNNRYNNTRKQYDNKNKFYPGTIKDVIFNDPATIVLWKDGTKTVVKCQPGDEYNKELGLAMAIIKKCCDNKGNYNDIFEKWIYNTRQN